MIIYIIMQFRKILTSSLLSD